MYNIVRVIALLCLVGLVYDWINNLVNAYTELLRAKAKFARCSAAVQQMYFDKGIGFSDSETSVHLTGNDDV